MPVARLLCSLCLLLAAAGATAALPPVPVPVENPITEEKRILGKLLFWDEQLSSDDTVACGTCHLPAAGGADPRVAFHPGPDALLGTGDDVRGSLGVVRRDVTGAPLADPLFGFEPQVTPRASMSFFAALWAPDVLWDGRASGTFVDPLDGVTLLIASGGGLESQALLPLLSDVEMAKEGRSWSDLMTKLTGVTPLALATDLPPDMAAALLASPSYPDLFASAFGDLAITPARIAFALATYQRTLVPDQTPWDAFVAGDTTALTPDQQLGLDAFTTGACSFCHEGSLFSDDSFRTLNVRDPSEDLGRESVTGLPADRASFKVPSLRNVGLRPAFMHTGDFTSVADVIDFYEAAPLFLENLDHNLPIDDVPDALEAPLADFVLNGLTDPRAANELFPFDRPTLLFEPASAWQLVSGGLALRGLARRRRQ